MTNSNSSDLSEFVLDVDIFTRAASQPNAIAEIEIDGQTYYNTDLNALRSKIKIPIQAEEIRE